MNSRRALEQIRVTCDQCPALARADGLAELKTVNSAIAHRSHRPPFVACSHALGTIFEYFQVALAGHRQSCVHISGLAHDVYRHNDFRPRRDVALDVRRVDIHGFIDFREYGRGPHGKDRVVAGIPGPGRKDDFVVRTSSERCKRSDQSSRAGRHRDAIIRALVRGEFFLEAVALIRHSTFWANPVPAERSAAVEHLQDFAALLLIVIERPREVCSKPGRADRQPSINGQGASAGDGWYRRRDRFSGSRPAMPYRRAGRLNSFCQ